MLRVYDTATRAVRDFEPRTPGRVSMYVCGPTVYDVPHVGHGRTHLTFDVMRRYLVWRGFEVTFVSNITDVEDRIIDRAAERGTTEAELATTFEREYWEQMDRLGVLRPTEMPHATEFVEQMQQLIVELVARGAAYVIEGQGVYFSVESFPGYGELSHRRVADLIEGAGARVEVDEQKRSPVDFALWKAAKPGEPAWDSRWGPGRPGWHIECSAMSLEILGEGFDVHGGGDDLVFPHHENERAQAEAAGHAFARYWLHSGMVVVGGEKMSKSLGNFTNLSDALERHGARAFRMLVLQTQYRSPMEIGDTELRQSAAAVGRLDAFARRARAAGVVPAGPPALDAFVAAMDDDFDTPKAIAVVFETVRRGNAALDAGRLEEASSALTTVSELVGVLGLVLDDGATTDGRAEEEIDRLVAARDEARVARRFDEADRIRDELAARGVTLEDTPHGTLWRR